ncbi:SpoIID/LytB domain-containing protein [Prochlorococcus sp. MIT 1300]|uniref:SpoIID/LytB domain-containing protein n=1 Tax=Prochlorococcus sp. MIT 1300 TaxID=3096218 RepID=UPI002A74D7E6|nr:SpoIID/LytB domain-containing protein [Prochlorococcus sp. MIT 1300]
MAAKKNSTKWLSSPFWMSAGILVLTLFCGACKPDSSSSTGKEISISAKSLDVPPTHRKVPLPPLIVPSNPVIWVSLASHLGGRSTEGVPVAPLVLKSPDTPLVLRDANGLEYQALEILLKWQSFPLGSPYKISRKVAGPFASFESAERFAFELRNSGLHPVIARPGEWEVWLPKGISFSASVPMELREQTIVTSIQPVLQINGSEKVLKGPINIEANSGLIWDGGVYQGPFVLQADAYGSWTLVEKVPLQRYLEGVVPHEIGSSSPKAALGVQAVLARTWALANSHRFLIDGYHLCSNTQCQVYKDPNYANSLVKESIKETAGFILSSNKKPIHAVYHASNGGVIASGTEAWAIDPLPYLKTKLDGPPSWNRSYRLPLSTSVDVKDLLKRGKEAYGSNHRRFRWTMTLTDSALKDALGEQGKNLILPLEVNVLKRGTSGRVLTLQVRGKKQKFSVILTLDAIRRRLPQLPSTLFVVSSPSEGDWRFAGGGFGHGVGLSQAGAIDLASRGWPIERILDHYYPGTNYAPLPGFSKAP